VIVKALPVKQPSAIRYIGEKNGARAERRWPPRNHVWAGGVGTSCRPNAAPGLYWKENVIEDFPVRSAHWDVHPILLGEKVKWRGEAGSEG